MAYIKILNLVYGVGVCALLFQPVDELLVWLMVCWDVVDGWR